MIDINFFMKFHDYKKRMLNNEKLQKEELFSTMETLRSPQPTVYNIETTNACNMKCKMCPRTTMMTRDIETLNPELFINIIEQLKPWTEEEWSNWCDFVVKEYNIQEDEMSENNFFLYIIPKVIQLHGYGDPLLDKNMPQYVKALKAKGFYSYFSCNPANIDIKQTEEMFVSGLDYIKYSIESTDDEKHKLIRGDESNFTKSYKAILDLLKLKAEKKYKTKIVITMLDLNAENQQEEFQKLREVFKDKDVYIYLKSEDQQWYREDYHGTNSIHWSEICQHPWLSMTIKSNAEVAMCMEDFNNDIVLGEANKNSLYDIWNGEKYNQFRKDHFNLGSNIKCVKECDMKLIGDFL